jgi:S-adenosylmethionine hydrolase
MIVLITDFGLHGPYIGQLQAAIYSYDPTARIISLFADAPVANPRATSYLINAYHTQFPAKTVFCCVVDPNVGGATDKPVIVSAAGKYFVGPDNGLFNTLQAICTDAHKEEILWRGETLSASFHGRDLYAPVAAMLSLGREVQTAPLVSKIPADWPIELAEIIYIDHYGNAMTGIRASNLPQHKHIGCNGLNLSYACTFSAVAAGKPFWYENSNGLVELAVNRGRADQVLGLTIGSRIEIN